jgi:hypothetical protein
MVHRADLVRTCRKARRALRLPPRELLTAARVLLVISLVEVAIRWIRLDRLTRWLGVRLDLRPVQANHELLPIESLPAVAQRQLRCTWKVADVWPFSEGPCLRRALVGGHLVRRLDPAIRLGVIGDADTMSAHAWLEIDGRPLERVDSYTRFEHAPVEAAN